MFSYSLPKAKRLMYEVKHNDMITICNRYFSFVYNIHFLNFKKDYNVFYFSSFPMPDRHTHYTLYYTLNPVERIRSIST